MLRLASPSSMLLRQCNNMVRSPVRQTVASAWRTRSASATVVSSSQSIICASSSSVSCSSSLHTLPSDHNISNDLLMSVSMNVQVTHDAETQEEMCNQLRKHGSIKSDSVYDAMSKVDRKYYARLPQGMPQITNNVPGLPPPSPYAHSPSPIGQCSTISSPYSHAIALEAIQPYVKPGCSVLDVGSGSGYLTACLAQMVWSENDSSKQGRVIALEHSSVLLAQSRLNIEADPLSAKFVQGASPIIEFVQGDGNDKMNTWISKLSTSSSSSSSATSPQFDVIHIGVAYPSIPLHYLPLLRTSGRMLVPVADSLLGAQHLLLIEKLSDHAEMKEGVGYKSKSLMACSYAKIAMELVLKEVRTPSADIDSLAPIIRERDAIQAQLDKHRDALVTWQTKYVATHQLTRKPTMAEMLKDTTANSLLTLIAPLNKKKAKLDKILEREQGGS